MYELDGGKLWWMKLFAEDEMKGGAMTTIATVSGSRVPPFRELVISGNN